jgi:hypothetical protein
MFEEMVNSQLSFVIGGGASRNHFLGMARRRRILKMTNDN